MLWSNVQTPHRKACWVGIRHATFLLWGQNSNHSATVTIEWLVTNKRSINVLSSKVSYTLLIYVEKFGATCKEQWAATVQHSGTLVDSGKGKIRRKPIQTRRETCNLTRPVNVKTPFCDKSKISTQENAF